MSLPSTIQDRDFNNFQDRGDGTTNRFVTDTVAQSKLDAIITALGGTGASNTTPAVNVISVPLANIEHSFSLPMNCKGFLVKSRGNSTLKFNYVTGVLTDYFTIPAGASYEDLHFYTSQSVYFATNLNGDSVEIVTFT